MAPEIDTSTGTLAGRAIIDNKDALLEPGLFVRVRIPKQLNVDLLLVPDIALGNDQPGGICWSSTPRTSSSSATSRRRPVR